MIDKISHEQMNNLYAMLQGDLRDEDSRLGNLPNLSSEQAFAVIYYLQEQMDILPDNYDRCDLCHCLVNRDNEAMYNSFDDDELNQAHDFPKEGRYCEDCSLPYYDNEKFHRLVGDL